MIFVTGGTGLLGAQLIADLVARNHEVRALKRADSSMMVFDNVFKSQFDDWQMAATKVHWVEGDVLDYFKLLEYIDSGDLVYHCAAFVSFDKNDHEKMQQINIEGTKNIVNICLEKSVEKLCHVSSIAAIGRGEKTGYCTENDHITTTKRKSEYSKSKYESELVVWRAIAEGLKAVIVNPSIILGSGDFSKGSSKLFETVFKGLKFYTEGTNGYVDVKDVSEVMIRLMESEIESERFILNSENISYQKLFELIAKGLNKKPPLIKAGKLLSTASWVILGAISTLSGSRPLITRETARSANSHFKYDSSKIKQAIGYNFIPLEETIERISKDYLKSNI